MDCAFDVIDGDFSRGPLDPSIRSRLQGAIDYLLEDPNVERGVMLRKDLSWVPFTNTVPPPKNVALIRMGPEDFATLADLMEADDFYGWLHSHPRWAAIPSHTDIEFHQFLGNMLIYSIPDDCLNQFSTAAVEAVDQERKIQGKSSQWH